MAFRVSLLQDDLIIVQVILKIFRIYLPIQHITLNPFIERYKDLSNVELLDIIDNPSDYQPIALQAAEEILKLRNPSNAEMEFAEAQLELKKRERRQQVEKRLDLEKGIRSKIDLILNTFNPISAEKSSAERIILLLVIIFGMRAISIFVNQYDMIRYALVDSTFGWYFGKVELITLTLYRPISLVLFWLKKRIGWMMFSIYLTYSLTNVLSILLSSFGNENLAYTSLNPLFQPRSNSIYLFASLFLAGALWAICTPRIREVYGIKIRTAVYCIILTMSIMFFTRFFILNS